MYSRAPLPDALAGQGERQLGQCSPSRSRDAIAHSKRRECHEEAL